MFFSTFHHQEILRRNSIYSVTAWPFMRSGNCLSFFFFEEDASRKFLILLLSYFFLFFDCKYHLHYFRWLCFFIPSARYLRFGSRLWKVNIDQNWNPFLSLFVVIHNFISQENVFLFAIYFHENMKLGPDSFFGFVTLKNCLRQHQLRNQGQLRLRNSLVAFYPQKANPCN